MIYDENIKMDENKKIIECPRCNNTEFSADAEYCKICGLPLYNKCGYFDDNGFFEGRGHINPGNARYCEICGCETIFFQLKVLSPYDKYAKKLQNITTTNDNNYDLPF